jgi:hypothetical protein
MNAYRISYRLSLITAFLQGMTEFRLSMTTSQPDEDHYEAYDRGRDLAHKLTLRKFEDSL